MSRSGRGLNRARILRAALELVDAEGLDALSMRRLGEVLGVQAMSLYRHLEDKDDLLDGLQGAVLAEMHLPPKSGTLSDRATLWSRALRQAFMNHPNTIPLFTSRAVVDPEALSVVESALESLTEAGLDDRTALDLYQTLVAFVLGHAVLERTPRAPLSLSPQARASPSLPTLRRLADLGTVASPEDAFEAGLRVLAAGIAAVHSGPRGAGVP